MDDVLKALKLARSQLEAERAAADKLANERVDAIQRAERAEAERDAAWAALKEIAIRHDAGAMGKDRPRHPLLCGGLTMKADLKAKWRPIETAPKDGRYVLIFCNEIYVARYDEPHDLWFFPVDGCAVDPTHWLPLPAPPEIADEIERLVPGEG